MELKKKERAKLKKDSTAVTIPRRKNIKTKTTRKIKNAISRYPIIISYQVQGLSTTGKL